MYKPENDIEAMATYEAWLYLLQKYVDVENKRSWLDKMIDEATGFDKQKKEELLPILEDMRDSLAFLWFDTKGIEKILEVVK